MLTSGATLGVGLTACLAHIAYVRKGIPWLLFSRQFRGRLRASTVELLYVGGTLFIAVISGTGLVLTNGFPEPQFKVDPWWLLICTVAVVISAGSFTPDPRSEEPSRLRRLLLCFGAGAEEVLWRGVAVGAIATTGLALPWAYLISTLGFASIHITRYGRRGMGFIALFSIAMSLLAWSCGLLAAITAHVAWNAYTALRRPPDDSSTISREPVDEW